MAKPSRKTARPFPRVGISPFTVARNDLREPDSVLSKRHNTHNALQPFSWWADRPGNSPERVQQIRAAFDELTPEEETDLCHSAGGRGIVLFMAHVLRQSAKTSFTITHR